MEKKSGHFFFSLLPEVARERRGQYPQGNVLVWARIGGELVRLVVRSFRLGPAKLVEKKTREIIEEMK